MNFKRPSQLKRVNSPAEHASHNSEIYGGRSHTLYCLCLLSARCGVKLTIAAQKSWQKSHLTVWNIFYTFCEQQLKIRGLLYMVDLDVLTGVTHHVSNCMLLASWRSSHERHLTIKVMSRHISVSIAIEIDPINILYFNLNDIPWQ